MAHLWVCWGKWVLRKEILKPGDFLKTSKFIGENCWAKLRERHTHTHKILFILLTYKQWQYFFPDRSPGCYLKQHQQCFKGSAKSFHFSSWRQFTWLAHYCTILFAKKLQTGSGLFFFLSLTLHTGKAMATHSSTLAWKNPMDGGAW